MDDRLWFVLQVGDIHGELRRRHEKDLRRRAGRVPVRLRRSIDLYRAARGLAPLWGSCGSVSSCEADAILRRRRKNREAKRRQRARQKEVANGR